MKKGNLRGLQRLFIALIVPWVLAWGVFASINAFNYYNAASDERIFSDMCKADPQVGTSCESFWSAMGHATIARHNLQYAVVFGPSVPIFLLISGWIGIWVWRGFRED